MSDSIVSFAQRALQEAVRGRVAAEEDLDRLPAELADELRAEVARVVALVESDNPFAADRERRRSFEDFVGAMEAARWSPRTPLRARTAEAEAAIDVDVAEFLGQISRY